MSDIVELQRRVSEVNVSPQFQNYSKVIIHVSDETAYEAGNDTGRTLEITNPFGTQEMAENILSSLSGYQYQPYTADGALLDPAAEVGDAVNVRGAYGGIYTREKTFGRLMKCDVSAPQDEEINHEYAYESPERREFKRSIDEVKASLFIGPNSIVAQVERKVGETGGDSSFGWGLTDTAHKWYSNGQEVMSVSASGLIVNGMVNAQNGTIANFTIGKKVADGETVGSANAIWNNISYFGGTQANGVYLGTDGIQLGQGFKVTPSGNLSLAGTLNMGGVTITPQDLANQANSAYTSTSKGGYCYGGASQGYVFGNATASSTANGPTYFNATQIRARGTLIGASLAVDGSASFGGNVTITNGKDFTVHGYKTAWKSIRVVSDVIGGVPDYVTFYYLGRK